MGATAVAAAELEAPAILSSVARVLFAALALPSVLVSARAEERERERCVRGELEQIDPERALRWYVATARITERKLH